MKAAAFDYIAPRDIAGLVAALAGAKGEAKLMAGGQSLGPMLNLRLARPKLLVDVGGVEALRRVEARGDSFWIGAGVTHAEIEDGAGPLPADGLLRAVAANIAYRAVRNRGTVGGSLAHADPAADWPLAFAAVDAVIHVRGPQGSRTLRADAYMIGAYTTTIAEDEVIEGVEVPRLSPGARWGYYKFCRKTGEFPDAAAAVVLDPGRRVARVFLGALDTAPKPLPALAAQLAETGRWTRDDCGRAVAAAAPDLDSVECATRAAALARALRQVLPQ
jgi:carbon-monoxide dehydrogenase medium subunit